MSVGRNVATERKKCGLSQEKLGELVGVTAAYISQIETGVKNPSYGLLLKLSNALAIPLENLIGSKSKEFSDPVDQHLLSLLSFLDTSRKMQLLEYVHLLCGTRRYHNFPFLESAIDYAQHILKTYKITAPPVDPYGIAERLGVSVITSEEPLEYEGMLHKSGRKPLIVLDGKMQNESRRKFTLSFLLGHLVIPWHMKTEYYRPKGKYSLDEENLEGVQAREFAGALMIPNFMLKKDFKDSPPGLKSFEKLAYEKYGSSILAIGHKYIQTHGKTSVLITADNMTFTRVYEEGFPYKLRPSVPTGSFAASFGTTPPKSKEIRSGILGADIWFEDVPREWKLFEESLLDPSYGITMTFLQLR